MSSVSSSDRLLSPLKGLNVSLSDTLTYFVQFQGFSPTGGKIVIKPRFEKKAESFSEGLAPFPLYDKWGYIDKTGKFVIEPRFEYAHPFSEGLAAVKRDDDKWGYIDKTGKFVIKPRFVNAAPFSEGLAAVYVYNPELQMGYIDKTGKFVIGPGFEASGDYFASHFSEGLALVADLVIDEDARWIDKKGRTIWPKWSLTVPKGYPSVEKMEQLIKAVLAKTIPPDWGIISSESTADIDVHMVEIIRIDDVVLFKRSNEEYLPFKASLTGSWKRQASVGEDIEEKYFHVTKDFMIYKDDNGDWAVNTLR